MPFPARPPDGQRRWFAEREAYDQAVEDAVTVIQGATPWVVIGDGTNQTTELRTALQSARDSATRKTVEIIGTVLVDWHTYGAADADVVTVYDGCSLQGRGRSSVIKGRSSTITNGQAHYLVRRQSYTFLAGFEVDGDKAGVNMSGKTQFVCVGIYGKDADCVSVMYDTLWIHGFAGITATSMEAHGIQTGDAESGTVSRNVQVWDIDAGSGIGTAGAPISGDRGADHVFENVLIHDCEWNGLALYGVDGVEARGVVTYGCGFVGLNVEYSTGVNFRDCLAYNSEVNMRLLGKSSVKAWGLVTYGATVREIDLVSGNASGVSEMGQTLVLYHPDITPGSGLPHIAIAPTTTNTGKATPELVKIITPDAASWRVTYSNSRGGKPEGGVQFEGLSVGPPAALGAVGTWTKSASNTNPAYVGSDDLGPSPVTLTATANYDTWESPAVLVANQTYLIRARIGVTVAEQWLLYLKASGNTVIFQSPSTAGDVGQWFLFDLIVTPNATATLQWDNDDSGSSTLVVDYFSATPIALAPGWGQ